jgi:hypothetical protein
MYKVVSSELSSGDRYAELARRDSKLCLKQVLSGNDDGRDESVGMWNRNLKQAFFEVGKRFFEKHRSLLEESGSESSILYSSMVNEVCAAIKEIEAHFSKIRNDVSAALSADVSSSLKDLQKKKDYSKLSSLIDLERRLKIELNRCYREALEKHLLGYKYYASDSKVELINSKVNSLFQEWEASFSEKSWLDDLLATFKKVDLRYGGYENVLFSLSKEVVDSQGVLEAKFKVDKNAIDFNKLKGEMMSVEIFINAKEPQLEYEKNQTTRVREECDKLNSVIVSLQKQVEELGQQLSQDALQGQQQEAIIQQIKDLESRLVKAQENLKEHRKSLQRQNNLTAKLREEIKAARERLTLSKKELGKKMREKEGLLKDLASREKDMLLNKLKLKAVVDETKEETREPSRFKMKKVASGEEWGNKVQLLKDEISRGIDLKILSEKEMRKVISLLDGTLVLENGRKNTVVAFEEFERIITAIYNLADSCIKQNTTSEGFEILKKLRGEMKGKSVEVMYDFKELKNKLREKKEAEIRKIETEIGKNASSAQVKDFGKVEKLKILLDETLDPSLKAEITKTRQEIAKARRELALAEKGNDVERIALVAGNLKEKKEKLSTLEKEEQYAASMEVRDKLIKLTVEERELRELRGLRELKLIAREYLADPKEDLKKKWFYGVSNIFSNKNNMFNEKAGEKWNSYASNKDDSLEVLKATERCVNEIRGERDGVIESTRDSILNKLRSVKQEHRNDTQRSKELERGVNKAYKFYRFENFSIDKGDEIYAGVERFRLKTKKIVNGGIGDKGEKLTEAYKEAEGNIDNIVKEVEQEEKRGKLDVSELMNKFRPYVNKQKNRLKGCLDEVMKKVEEAEITPPNPNPFSLEKEGLITNLFDNSTQPPFPSSLVPPSSDPFALPSSNPIPQQELKEEKQFPPFSPESNPINQFPSSTNQNQPQVPLSQQLYPNLQVDVSTLFNGSFLEIQEIREGNFLPPPSLFGTEVLHSLILNASPCTAMSCVTLEKSLYKNLGELERRTNNPQEINNFRDKIINLMRNVPATSEDQASWLNNVKILSNEIISRVCQVIHGRIDQIMQNTGSNYGFTPIILSSNEEEYKTNYESKKAILLKNFDILKEIAEVDSRVLGNINQNILDSPPFQDEDGLINKNLTILDEAYKALSWRLQTSRSSVNPPSSISDSTFLNPPSFPSPSQSNLPSSLLDLGGQSLSAPNLIPQQNQPSPESISLEPQLSEEEKRQNEQLNKRLLLLQKDLELIKEKLSIDDDDDDDDLQDSLERIKDLESMNLEDKSDLEWRAMSLLSSVSEDNLDELDKLIQSTTLPREKLQYLGVKAILYIYKANGVGIKWKVYELRERIEDANDSEFNSLKDNLEALKREIEVRKAPWISLNELGNEIYNWIEEVEKDSALSVEKGVLEEFGKNVEKAKKVIEGGGGLPKLDAFEFRFNEIKAEQSLAGVKKKIELINGFNELLASFNEIERNLLFHNERVEDELKNGIWTALELVEATNAKDIDNNKEGEFKKELEEFKKEVEKLKHWKDEPVESDSFEQFWLGPESVEPSDSNPLSSNPIIQSPLSQFVFNEEQMANPKDNTSMSLDLCKKAEELVRRNLEILSITATKETQNRKKFEEIKKEANEIFEKKATGGGWLIKAHNIRNINDKIISFANEIGVPVAEPMNLQPTSPNHFNKEENLSLKITNPFDSSSQQVELKPPAKKKWKIDEGLGQQLENQESFPPNPPSPSEGSSQLQLSEEEQFNKRLLLLKKDFILAVAETNVSYFELNRILKKVENLESMTLEAKRDLEHSIISTSGVAFLETLDVLDKLIADTQTSTKEKLKYLGVKVIFYIGDADGVGIKEKVYELRGQIEVAIEGNSSEEDFNRLNDELDNLKKDMNGRHCLWELFTLLGDEIEVRIERIGDDEDLSEIKWQLESLKENVKKAKCSIERGGLPKLDDFKNEFDRIKVEQSLRKVKGKIEELNPLPKKKWKIEEELDQPSENQEMFLPKQLEVELNLLESDLESTNPQFPTYSNPSSSNPYVNPSNPNPQPSNIPAPDIDKSKIRILPSIEKLNQEGESLNKQSSSSSSSSKSKEKKQKKLDISVFDIDKSNINILPSIEKPKQEEEEEKKKKEKKEKKEKEKEEKLNIPALNIDKSKIRILPSIEKPKQEEKEKKKEKEKEDLLSSPSSNHPNPLQSQSSLDQNQFPPSTNQPHSSPDQPDLNPSQSNPDPFPQKLITQQLEPNPNQDQPFKEPVVKVEQFDGLASEIKLDLTKDLNDIEPIAEEYLADPKEDLRREWYTRVWGEFLHSSKAFNGKSSKEWNSYNENKTLEVLKATERCVNEIRGERDGALKSTRDSILDKLKNVKQEGTETEDSTEEDTTQIRIEELKGDVNKVCECLRFDNFRIDKEDEIYVERERFRFGTIGILDDDNVEDKHEKLTEAYEKAKRKIDSIVEEVEQTAEGVKKNDSMKDFEKKVKEEEEELTDILNKGLNKAQNKVLQQNIEQISKEYLTAPKNDLKEKWSDGVNSIFLNDSKVFNERGDRKWKSYFESDTKSLKSLREVQDFVEEIPEERKKALKDNRTSILNKLKDIKVEGIEAEDTTQRRKELEDEVDKVYKFYGFDNFCVDAGDDLYTERERFRLETEDILNDDSIEDKPERLDKAYEEAEGNINIIVEDVEEEAEEVKMSTGFNIAVDDSMNEFGLLFANEKNELNNILDVGKQLELTNIAEEYLTADTNYKLEELKTKCFNGAANIFFNKSKVFIDRIGAKWGSYFDSEIDSLEVLETTKDSVNKIREERDEALKSTRDSILDKLKNVKVEETETENTTQRSKELEEEVGESYKYRCFDNFTVDKGYEIYAE